MPQTLDLTKDIRDRQVKAAIEHYALLRMHASAENQRRAVLGEPVHTAVVNASYQSTRMLAASLLRSTALDVDQPGDPLDGFVRQLMSDLPRDPATPRMATILATDIAALQFLNSKPQPGINSFEQELVVSDWITEIYGRDGNRGFADFVYSYAWDLGPEDAPLDIDGATRFRAVALDQVPHHATSFDMSFEL